MELMSSLLLCALAALVPLTSGKLSPPEIQIDELKMIGKLPVTRTKVMMNPNSPAVIRQNDYSVLAVPQCQHCLHCIEMAIHSRQREHKHVSILPHVEEPYYANDMLESYHQYKSFRDKRESDKIEETSLVNMKPDNKMKENKTVTVTKYSTGGQVYALKIKEELDGADQDNETACRVYTVKKYYPCDVPEEDLMMLLGKKRGKRARKVQTVKQKKIHDQALNTTEKAKSIPQEAKMTKTNADTSQMSENYMTSIEELY